MKRGSEEGRRGSKEGGGIATLFCLLVMALSGCRRFDLDFRTPPPAAHRYPFAAVVWQLEDKTGDFGFRTPSADGLHDYESSLAGSRWPWWPALTSEDLSVALAQELKARLTQDAWVNGDPLEGHMTFSEMARGAEVFVGGEVVEASWDRSDGEQGRFRLRVKLHATIGRRDGEDLRGFWQKEVTADVPHKAWAGPELAAALDAMLGSAVDDLAKALAKEPAASVLAAATPGEGADK